MGRARERWADVVDAWRHRSVKIGFAGTTLILLGSLTPAYLPQNSPWWGPMRALRLDSTPAKIAGTFVVVAGILLLVDGWFRLRPAAYEHVKHWAVLLIWSLPFLLAPPIFSHDAYSYAAQGWMLVNDVNPYEGGPGILPGAFADQVAWVWRYTPAPYGPLSMRIQEAIVVLCQLQPYWSAVMMRVPALAGVWLIVVLLPRIAHRMGINPQQTAWYATLNPLLVIDFVGGAHNDSLMMGLVILAIWLSFKRHLWVVGALVIGVAASIKQPAFLAAYALPLVASPLQRWAPGHVAATVARIVASCLAAIGSFVVISWLCGLGFGWLNAVNVPGLVVTVSPFTIVGQGIQIVLDFFRLDPSHHVAITAARTLGLVITVGAVLLMAATTARRKPITFLSWSYLVVAFCAPALHSWYVLWGALLLPLTRPSVRMQRTALWATVVLLSYSAVNLAWRNGALALGIAALGLFAWRVRSHENSRPQDDPSEEEVVVP